MLFEDTSGIDFWLAGDPFLRAYLAVFDMDNQKIGLAGKNIDNGYYGPNNNSTSDNSGNGSGILSSYIIWIVLAAGISILVPVLVCIIRRCCCKRNIAVKNDIRMESYPNNYANNNMINTLTPYP